MFQFSHWGQEQLHCSWIFTHRGWMWTTCMHFPLPPERHQLLRELKGARGMRPQQNMGEASIPKFPEFIIHWKKTFPIASLAGLTSINWLGRKKKFTLWAKIPKQLLGARGPPKLRKTDSQHCYPEWASLICAWSPVLGFKEKDGYPEKKGSSSIYLWVYPVCIICCLGSKEGGGGNS